MKVCESIAKRILQMCGERSITLHGLSCIAGVPQSTIQSILNGKSKNPRLSTLKKLCDGFEITLAEFFDTEEFNELEQELV